MALGQIFWAAEQSGICLKREPVERVVLEEGAIRAARPRLKEHLECGR